VPLGMPYCPDGGVGEPCTYGGGKLRSFALKKSIDLIVVGPEVPLMEGIVDVLKRRV